MTIHQLGPISPGYVDKRRASKTGDANSRIVTGLTVFTANAGGTTTTIVGANAAPGTNDTNVIRRGERVKLFNSSGVLKEETVFQTTTVAVGASTTVTFAPAAAVATASGDFMRLVGTLHLDSMDAIDDRLAVLGFSASHIGRMTLNDKMYQLRVSDDPGSL
ncbi:MAG: hypothetical protein ACREOB_05160 [Thermodesulfobacteriota bacterium]